MWIFRDSTQVYLSSQKYFNALDVMIFSKKSPSCKLKRQSNRTQIAILNVAVFVDYDAGRIYVWSSARVESCVAQCLERPTSVEKIMGSTPVGDSELFSLSACSWQAQ